MAFASLSIYGLYTYNNEIFDNLVLPDGMDKDTLSAEILTECSDFCLLYPNYDFMKMLIGVWSQKELHIWTNLWNSEHFEYNPIENYDRHESISRAVTGKSAGESNSSSSDSSTGNSKSTGAKTSYDSGTFNDTAREIGESSSAGASASAEKVSNESSGTETVTTHAHGNIGVTTAAQMIQGYRDISKFCTYDFIVQSFKDRFCVQVY